ncbi:hypothetical protein Hanom_Chr02g00161901 [Helianthus anomalus]
MRSSFSLNFNLQKSSEWWKGGVSVDGDEGRRRLRVTRTLVSARDLFHQNKNKR